MLFRSELANPVLTALGSSTIEQKVKLISLISRPEITFNDIEKASSTLKNFTNYNCFSEDEITQAEILMKYEGYIDKEQETVKKLNRFEDISLHESFNYGSLKSLSTEARQKLTKIKPRTLGQASRISGVSPADISVLLIHLGR